MHTLRHHILPRRFIKERDTQLLEMCANKNVLHIWATDSPLTRWRFELWELLFSRVNAICKKQIWIDIDTQAIAYLKDQWYTNIIQQDMNSLSDIKFTPDVILFTDTLEHVTNAWIALENLKSVMQNNTQLIITVPNALSIKNVFWSCWRKLDEHPDHSLSFTYQTLYQLLEKVWFTKIQGSFCNYQYSTVHSVLWRKCLSALYRIAIMCNRSYARTLYFVVQL